MDIFAGDVMIDIECLGVNPDSLILTIAAVGFDPLGQGIITDHSLYCKISTDSQPDRSIDDQTVEWWSTQSERAKEEAFGANDRVPLGEALDQLSRLVCNARKIWANGPTYDMTILENAYKQLGKPLPWRYYKVMDARTVYNLVSRSVRDTVRTTNDHHALQDCINQVELLQYVLRHLNIRSLDS